MFASVRIVIFIIIWSIIFTINVKFFKQIWKLLIEFFVFLLYFAEIVN